MQSNHHVVLRLQINDCYLLSQEKSALYEEMLLRHSQDLDEKQREAEDATSAAQAEHAEAVRQLEARLAELEARAAASGWNWNHKVQF